MHALSTQTSTSQLVCLQPFSLSLSHTHTHTLSLWSYLTQWHSLPFFDILIAQGIEDGTAAYIQSAYKGYQTRDPVYNISSLGWSGIAKHNQKRREEKGSNMFMHKLLDFVFVTRALAAASKDENITSSLVSAFKQFCSKNETLAHVPTHTLFLFVFMFHFYLSLSRMKQ
jgi:lipocalin